MALGFNHWSGKAPNLPVARHVDHCESSLIHQCMKVWQDRWHSERILRGKNQNVWLNKIFQLQYFVIINIRLCFFHPLVVPVFPPTQKSHFLKKPYLVIWFLLTILPPCATHAILRPENLRILCVFLFLCYNQLQDDQSQDWSKVGFDLLHLP